MWPLNEESRRPSFEELNPELRAIEPYDLARPSLSVRYRKVECRWNPIGGLDLQAGSGRRHAAHGAWDPPAAEKNLPGLEHPHAWDCSAVIHGRIAGKGAPSLTAGNFQKFNAHSRLVSRFRSSQALAAPLMRTSESKGH
jgi:hypothetical protein